MIDEVNMPGFRQEFFWTPTELVEWIQRIVPSMRLWLVLWPIGGNAHLAEVRDLQADIFNCQLEDSIRLFLGDTRLSADPVWRHVNGRQLLDFQLSYAVQLVPSVIAPNCKTLLQGNLAILSLSKYEDAKRASDLMKLCRRLRSDMKRSSDGGRVVVQRLPSGEKKILKGMLIGREVPIAGGLELKQFAQGAVTFEQSPA
jgi:hypothetical protein